MSNTPKIISFSIPDPGKECFRAIIKINPKEMGYMVNILEGYDCVGVARTINQTEGTVEILASPDYVEQLREIVYALQEEIELSIIRL